MISAVGHGYAKSADGSRGDEACTVGAPAFLVDKEIHAAVDQLLAIDRNFGEWSYYSLLPFEHSPEE